MTHIATFRPVVLRVALALLTTLGCGAALAQSPTISSFSPTSGGANTVVTVTGTNLTNVKSVVLRGIPCNITPISATQASFQVPAQASTGPIRLTTTGGTVLSGSSFTVTRASTSLTYVLRTNTFNSIDVGDFSMPAFTDLDHDGLIDMLVGKEVDGLVAHYEQSSANSTSFILRATNLSGVSGHYNSIVSVTDIDGDGLLEMVVGSGAGNFKHYEQTAANSTSFTQLSNDFNNVFSAGGMTYQSPHFTDIDGDGLLDLLVGDEFLSRYEQTAANGGTFTQLNNQNFGPTADAGNGGSEVCVIDLDGDNLLDMLVARSNGQLFHYEQSSANGTAFTQVSTAFSGINVSGYPGSAITDLDGDGLLDLILGGFDGNLRHYEQLGTPTITSFNPTSGPVGTSVTVTGTNLDGATAARVNGTAGTIVGTPTATSLTFTVGGGSTTGAVSVVTPGGTATGSTFTVIQTPTITSFTPTSGPVGTSVTITGTNLTGATAARVNGTNGTIVGTPTATSLTFTVGAGSTTGAVSVVTPGGTATGATFTVIQAPTITSFTPTSGPVGTSVTITGTNLTGATAVTVNGTAGTILGTPTATSLTFTVGAGSTTGAVSVTTPGGTATGGTFTVLPAPTITSFTPTSGPVSTSVTITGTNLTGATAARVNGTAGTIVGTPTATSLTFTVGAGSTTGTVSVVTPGGTATGATFTVIQAPTITSFTPTSGPVGTSVTITGTNLTGATAARVNGTAGTIVGTPTATSLTFTVGAGSTTGVVSVVTPGGTATGATFTVIPAPTITSFTPTSGPVSTSVTITGTNLTGATAARVNGTAGTIVGTPTATSLTFTVGAGSSTGAVSVTTPGGTATGATFTVTQVADLAIAVSDSPDPVAEGSTLTYTLTVSNAGPSAASSVAVSFALPAGAVFSSASGTGWAASQSSGTVTATRATLAVGTAPVITVQVQAPGEGGTISATATVSSATTDPNNANNSATATTTVTGVNDAPVVTTSGGSTAWVQSGGAVAVDGAATVTDVDNATLASATVSITTSFSTTQDVLAFTNANGITGTYNAGTGVLTLSGSASLANYQAALRAVTYNNTAGSPSGTSRTIRFVVNDGSANSAAVTKTVTITTQTVAPVVNAPANGNSTNDTTPTYSGTAPASSTVTVYVDGSSIGTAIATAGGTWTKTQSPALSQGVHTVYATAQSTGKPVSVASNTNSFTIDTTAPTVTISSSAGASGGTTGTSPIPVTITFSEAVTGFTNSVIAVTNGTKSGFTAVNATTYTVNVTPSGAAPVTVTINVGAGAANDAAGNVNTAATAFTLTYVGAPTITGFTPASGPAGTSVTITGTSFTGATAVSFNGTAAASFTVNSATSITATVAAGTTTGTVSVTTPSGTGTSGTSFTVRQAPTALALAPQSVNENVAANTTVGTFSTTDPDAGDSFTYTLVSGAGSTDNGLVNISGATVRITASPDFEAKSSYAIRVRTTGTDGLWLEQTFTLTVNNLNEAPTALGLSPQSVAENTAGGTAIGNFSSTDPDAGDTFTYALVSGAGSTDNGAFSISGNQLVVTAAPDFEAQPSYAIRVRTTDQGGQSFTQTFTITVTNLNEAPSISPQTFTLAENSATGTTVGTVAATDPDAGATLSYSITAGNTGGAFSFVGNQLRVAAAAALDFETTPTFSLTVQVSDGSATDQATVTVNLTNVNEAPTALALAPQSVNENVAANTTVGTFSTTDPDAGSTFTYALVSGTGSGDNAAFTISGDQLRIVASPDFEAQSSYAIRVRTTDNGTPTQTREQTFTISVTDLDEGPSISPQTFGLAENSANGTTVGTVAAADPEGGALTYSITGGNTGGAFTFTGSSLQVANSAALDFETTPTFSLTVQVSDGTTTDNATVTVNLTNVNEAPTALALTPQSIAENTGANAVVGTLSTTDPDAGNTFTYTLVSGVGSADNGLVNISGTTLRITASPNFEAKSSYAVRVRATDQGGQFTEQAFTVSITDVNEAPVIGNQTRAVAENSATGTNVGAALPATDPEADALTYSITAGNTGGVFAIDPASGQLTVNGPLDFEGTNTYSLNVQVTDGTLTDDATITVNVTNVNEAPAIANQTRVVAESAGIGANVGAALTATDPDAGTTLTYTLLSGNTGGAFALSSATGQLTVAGTLDAQTTPTYTLTVQVSDGTLTDNATVTVNVTDVNGAPTALALSNNTLAENTGANAVVGTLSTTDPDAGDSFTYALVGGAGSADNGLVNISGSTLRITASPDFETKSSYAVRVRSTDQGGLSVEQTFVLTITDVNETPTNLALGNVTVAENTGANAVVGTLSTTDPDAGDSFTYTLVSGTGSTDNGLVNISGNQLRVTASPDFETKSSYAVRVRSTDQGGLFTTRALTFTVTDENEAPVIGNQTRVVAENSATGTNVGAALPATDPDAGATLTYSITAGNTGSVFAIDPVSGQLTVNGPLNFEGTSTYSLNVRVTDGSLTDDATVTVNITNVNEAPTALALAPQSVAENTGANAVVGTLSTTDPDAGNTFTYTLVSGAGSADNGLVNLSGSTLRITASPNFEAKSSYAVRVRTTDQGGQFTEQAFTLTVTDVNEAPSINPQTLAIAENSANGATVGSVTATDPEGATLTYSITGGNTGGAFTFVGSSLRVANSAVLDFETTPTFTLTVQVSDGALTDDATITVNLTDVVEAPTGVGLSPQSLPENQASGTAVGNLSTNGPGNGYTYSLVSGAGSGGNGAFQIVGSQLRTAAVFDYEAQSSYAIRVRSTETGNPGNFLEQTFTISVTDVNEAPSVSPQTFAVNENSANGTTVGTVTASDPDAGATLSYSIMGGNTGGAFTFVGNQLRVANAAALDFETMPSFSLTVRVSDGTLTDNATVTVTLGDVDDTAPTVLISSAAGSPTSTTPIPVTISFSEPVTGFTAADVVVTNGTVAGFSGSGASYSLDLVPGAPGQVSVDVAANAGQDTAGNPSAAAPTFTITYSLALTTTTWTGDVSTNWFTAGNWTNGVPTSALDALLEAGAPRYPVIGSGAADAQALSIASGARLTLSGGTLDLQAGFTNSGLFTHTGGEVTLTGAANQSVGGTATTTFTNLTVGAAGATLLSPVRISRVLTLTGDLTTGGNLTLLSSASGTAMVVNAGGAASGAATVQRYLTPGTAPGLGYRHLSAPVQGTTVADLTVAGTNGFGPIVNGAYNAIPAPTLPAAQFPNVFGFDETRGGPTAEFEVGYYSPASLTSGLEAGRGYAVYMRPLTPDFVGTLTTGDVTVAGLTRTGTISSNTDKPGWQLLGNPYPSPIDWDQVSVPAGMSGSISVYKSTGGASGGYLTRAGGTGSLPDGLVAMGQGFFGRVTDAGPVDFTFANSMRVTAYENPSHYRPAPTPQPVVSLSLGRVGEPVADRLAQAFVTFRPDATAGLDDRFDGPQPGHNTGTVPTLVSLTATGEELAINALASTALQGATTVPLLLDLPTSGSWELAVGELANLAGTDVALLDAVTGTRYDLSVTPKVMFRADAGVVPGRFALELGARALGLAAGVDQQPALRVYPNPATTMVQVSGVAKGTAVELLDATGRVVRRVVAGAEAAALRLSLEGLPTGVYAVRAGTQSVRLVVE